MNSSAPNLAKKQQILNNLNRKEDEIEPKIISRPAFAVIGLRYKYIYHTLLLQSGCKLNSSLER